MRVPLFRGDLYIFLNTSFCRRHSSRRRLQAFCTKHKMYNLKLNAPYAYALTVSAYDAGKNAVSDDCHLNADSADGAVGGRRMYHLNAYGAENAYGAVGADVQRLRRCQHR